MTGGSSGAVVRVSGGGNGFWWDCWTCACAFGPLVYDHDEAQRGADAHNNKHHLLKHRLSGDNQTSNEEN